VSQATASGIQQALEQPKRAGQPALVAFLTGGFPQREGWGELLSRVASEADVVEVGVPFTDPMADGVSIQRASKAALEDGVTLRWILDTLKGLPQPPQAPILLMSYLNPLLSLGNDLVAELQAAGVAGLIVPDLPLEESAGLRAAFVEAGLGLVQMVTPVTPEPRVAELCRASGGFVYAVTVTGITGGKTAGSDGLVDYLQRVQAASPIPVLAGFGIRGPEQVATLGAAASGVIVGTALIECLERGDDPVAFLRSLRP
jgi:tryptophan synthase alpha chain